MRSPDLSHLVGTTFVTTEGQQVQILEVFDYEPEDRSVGIFGGFVPVKGNDGNDYIIDDDGGVTLDEHPDKRIGQVQPLFDNHEPDMDFDEDGMPDIEEYDEWAYITRS